MKKPEHRPTSAGEFKAIAIVLLIVALMLVAVMPLAYGDIDKAKLSRDDYTKFTFTFESLRYETDDDTADRTYYLNVKESEIPLYVTELLDTSTLRNALSKLRTGDILTGYAEAQDEYFEAVELNADGTVFSFEDYNEAIRDNAIGLMVVLALFLAVLLVILAVMLAMRKKALRREKALYEKFRLKTLPPPRAYRERNEEGLSKTTYVTLIVAICILFSLVFVCLIGGIVLMADYSDMTDTAISLFIASGVSLAVGIVLLTTQYKAMTRYEKKSFGRKLYRTELTVVELATDSEKLTASVLSGGYQTVKQGLFMRTRTAHTENGTQYTDYSISLVNEDGLRAALEALDRQPKKQKPRGLMLDIYFVFVESTLDTAISDLYRMIAETSESTRYGYTPILIYEGSAYFVKIGASLRTYRQGLNEALYLLGLL